MIIFDGYVFIHQLHLEAKVSQTLFAQMENIEIKKMGSAPVVKIESLPPKYKKIALEKCKDLEHYYSFSAFSEELGLDRSYLSMTNSIHTKRFDVWKYGKKMMIKLSNEFVGFVKQGLTPFLIKNDDDLKYAEKQIEMQGFRIGFY